MKAVKIVKRASRSPLNARRWLCELECGHEVWITQDVVPTQIPCLQCDVPAPAERQVHQQLAQVSAAQSNAPTPEDQPTPTVPGFYWVKSQQEGPQVVEVTADEDGIINVWLPGMPSSWDVRIFSAWRGPLPSPWTTE